jgi:RNA polymerase sigma-70 factor (ECF subfamily)
LVRERLAARTAPGRYQLLAAISAVHTSARDVHDDPNDGVAEVFDWYFSGDVEIHTEASVGVAHLRYPSTQTSADDVRQTGASR